MIDISQYINKLNALQNYLWYSICFRECERKMVELFYETGMLLHSTEQFQPFEVWLHYHGWIYEFYND